MTTSSLHRQVEGHLRGEGIRYTPGRRAVVTALGGADGPRSAAELHGQLTPALPLSSLYRTLVVLEGAGILEPHHGEKGVTRYEVAEWLVGHHHHLVCMNCGTVEDITLTDKQESQLEKLVDAVTNAVSFRAGGHSLEIGGRCARCA